MLRVKAIQGEPTRFWVESNTLQCMNTRCAKLYTRHQRHRLIPKQSQPTSYLRSGDACPECGAKLEKRYHVVDISSNHSNGSCGCEYFEFVHAPKLKNLSPAERGAGKHRCSHIIAAREFALDVALHAHRHEAGDKAE